jgi:hypothetical protein
MAFALLAATMLTPPQTARAAPGDALGPEFRVNTFTTSTQWFPAVAMDADGDFVVAWQSTSQDGDGYGVFAQLFDAAGRPVGDEFQVNSFATGQQFAPTVAMDADGDFVVAWGSDGQDGGGFGVFAQRYDAAGNPLGGEFQVNGFTAGSQFAPSAAMDADGDFVVAWESSADQDGDGYGVFAQRYDAAGAAQGTEFRVNGFTAGFQILPSVAMDADGDFVVAWVSDFQDGSAYGVIARRYDAAGNPVGGEFRVNSFTANSQSRPSVAMDADGDFVVAWQSKDQDGSDYGVYAQRFDAAGGQVGGEVRVNSFTADRQRDPSVAMDADGDVVVAWGSEGQDGAGFGIFAQRFDGAERVAGDFDGDGNGDILWRNGSTGATVLWLMEGATRLAAQTIGAPPPV